MSRPARLTLAFLGASVLVGLAATALIVSRTDSQVVRPTPGVIVAGVLVALSTVANLGLRFVRWHYLLRRMDVRMPTVASLGAYVGSFALLPVPLTLGQLWARWRLAPTTTPDERVRVMIASVWERGFDAWALALLVAVTPGGIRLPVLAMTLVALVPAARSAALQAMARATVSALRLVARDAADAAVAPAPGLAPATWIVLALTSLLAWGTTALAILPLARAAGIDAPAGDLAGTAAGSTLIGGLALVPLGAGTMGFALAQGLAALGAAGPAVVQVTVVYRAATAWLTLALGGAGLWLARQHGRRHASHDHFDAIDSCYDAWLPAHYRTHLVRRKTDPILAALGDRRREARGLDIGCGRGWYLAELIGHGVRMAGVDTSGRQLAAAVRYLSAAVPLAQGSVLALPYHTATFDFAYIVNVLHHMPSPGHQHDALAEIARVVRPGGAVFVHEMNVRNPLFRLYLGYVFPLLKGIEEGTEHYLDPRGMPTLPGLTRREVRYFTFVPDFVPPALLARLAGLERRLEASALAPWAAHFVAVFERTDEVLAADRPGGIAERMACAPRRGSVSPPDPE